MNSLVIMENVSVFQRDVIQLKIAQTSLMNRIVPLPILKVLTENHIHQDLWPAIAR